MEKQKNNEETKETMWCETQFCKPLHIINLLLYIYIIQGLQEVLMQNNGEWLKDEVSDMPF